jgi:hypothetical protein
MLGKNKTLQSVAHRDYLLQTPYARSLAKDLYSQGADVLYCMLFRASFRFSDTLLRETTLSSSHIIPNNITFSVALHSRHSNKQDNGCDITKEQACLQLLLDSAAQQTLDCHVFVMADRTCTIQRVSEFLRKTTCRVETANHDEGQSWRSEHGPFAGVGYFQDWILASRARSAFVGTRRSSSHLIQELIAYDRRMEGNVQPLLECKL